MPSSAKSAGGYKLRTLQMKLMQLRGPEKPSPSYEQYSTPPDLAATILFDAFQAGDVAGKLIADLGCGTGVFAIGAAMLGAAEVFAFDIDHAVLEVAEKNKIALLDKRGADRVRFEQRDILDVHGKFDTVFQNPPFGAQSRNADVPFLVKAIEIGNVIYTIHQISTMEFVTSKVRELGCEIVYAKRFKYRMPWMFNFHTKAHRDFELILYKLKVIR